MRLPSPSALALLVLLALPAAAMAADAPARELRIDQFYAGSGPQGPEFSPAMREAAGKRVRIAGFAAPAFRAEAAFFVLTRSPMHVCPYCAQDNAWPVDVVVVHTRGVAPAGGPAPIAATGRLEIGPKLDPETGMTSQVRLVDAVVEAAR